MRGREIQRQGEGETEIKRKWIQQISRYTAIFEKKYKLQVVFQLNVHCKKSILLTANLAI